MENGAIALDLCDDFDIRLTARYTRYVNRDSRRRLAWIYSNITHFFCPLNFTDSPIIYSVSSSKLFESIVVYPVYSEPLCGPSFMGCRNKTVRGNNAVFVENGFYPGAGGQIPLIPCNFHIAYNPKHTINMAGKSQ